MDEMDEMDPMNHGYGDREVLRGRRSTMKIYGFVCRGRIWT